MIKEKKISVLISTFNKLKFIKNTIKSCLNQKYNNYEIIIVDTGSTDGTRTILKSYLKSKKIKIKLTKKKYNTSPLNQINAVRIGLNLSKGEIICLLDGDDIFKKNKLKEINKFYTNNDKAGFVQDMLDNKQIYQKIDRSFLSYKILPKFFPTSTFSIKKKKLINFFKECNHYNFDLLEIDARLFFYAKLFKNDHYLLNKKLTNYTNDPSGISSKYKKFSGEWFKKRKQAHFFLNLLYKNKKYPYKLDFFLSKFFFKLIHNLNFYKL